MPVYIVDKMTGSGKPPKPGEELKPQSARNQVRQGTLYVLYNLHLGLPLAW